METLYQSDHVRVVELGIIVQGHWLTVREFTLSQYPHFAKEMSCTRH